MPTQLPVWLKGEIDTNYIILNGIPHIDNKDEITFIRIFDSQDFVLREFEIEVIEDDNFSDDRSAKDSQYTRSNIVSRNMTSIIKDSKQRNLSTVAKKVKNAIKFSRLAKAATPSNNHVYLDQSQEQGVLMHDGNISLNLHEVSSIS